MRKNNILSRLVYMQQFLLCKSSNFKGSSKDYGELGSGGIAKVGGVRRLHREKLKECGL